MKVVYEASSELEAQMIANLIGQAGIESELVGAELVGGVGELPAINLVKVVVDPVDASRAQDLVSEWESQQKSAAKQKTPRVGSFGAFIIGAGVASAVILWATFLPISEEGADRNLDGSIDVHYYYSGARLARIESDDNFDGKIDVRSVYSNGVVVRSTRDQDFDGAFETSIEYDRGRVSRVLTDYDGDGKTDRRSKLKDGVLTEIEHLSKHGTILKRQHYLPSGLLERALLDTDRNAIFDMMVLYDQLEEETERFSIPRD